MRTRVFRCWRHWCLVALAVGLVQMTPAMAQPVVGSISEYTVQPGDFLIKIGARAGVSAEDLARDNGLRYEALLKPGQKLSVDNRHVVPLVTEDGLYVNLPQRMLYYFREGELLAAYPVGLGKPSWPTPRGEFTIVDKVENKTWRVPVSIQEEMRREGQVVRKSVPPGPDNPLGKHWLGLSISAIGIHGTIAPASIYQFRSHGCIRLHPDDIAALFARVERGEKGRLMYAPLLLAESDGRVYLEVHRDIYRKGGVSLEALRQAANDRMLTNQIDWTAAEEVLTKAEGTARDVTLSVE